MRIRDPSQMLTAYLSFCPRESSQRKNVNSLHPPTTTFPASREGRREYLAKQSDNKANPKGGNILIIAVSSAFH